MMVNDLTILRRVASKFKLKELEISRTSLRYDSCIRCPIQFNF
jgi:hypothetical protein